MCDLYVRQERVKRTAADQSPCGCDLYVRQERVKCTAAEQSPCGCDLYVSYSAALLGTHTLGSYR